MPQEILTTLKPELLALVPILYTIAEIIKATKKIKNWLIPFILWGISFVLVTCYMLLSFALSDSLLIGFLQGTILAMTTVGSNQCYKQITEKRYLDE